MSERSERDGVTRDLRGGSDGSDGSAAGHAATATAAPTPTSSPIAETVDDTSSGAGYAATLGAAADGPDLVGKSLDRYRVLARLGAGGMGVVYAALDPALDRKVALKVLPPMARDREAHLEARLRREAQALARLDHPNVVRVYDVGVAAHSVFVAMQLVDGLTLADWLDKDKPPPRDVIAAFVAAGRGLAAAHAAGIVHRDVKPSNILLDRSGRVCVGDFGLARGADAPEEAGEVTTTSENLLDEAMTREGRVLGTPLFMSPEQHQGTPATPRSDQFSFCVSLWQALFDAHPFVPNRWVMAQAIDAMARDAIRDPASTRGVPARVIRALRRGMRHDPDARWPSMDALLEQLAPRSRAPWIAIGLAAAGIAGGAALSFAVGGGAADPCANAGAELSTTWGASTAKLLRDGFEATRLPYAGGLAAQVIQRLDTYGEGWAAMRVDACRANRRGEQSDALLDRRMRCLDRRLAEASELVRILTHAPTADLVDRSLVLVDGISPLDECKNTAALGDLVEQPAAPAVRVERAQLDIAIVRLNAQMDAGLAKDAIADADALVVSARRLGDAAVLGRALVLAGDARFRVGQDVAAMPFWREAAPTAARAHDDVTATKALHQVATALDYAGKPDQALVAIDDAEVFASRTNKIDANLEADLLVERGAALDELNRFPESDAAYAKAVAIEEAAHGKDSWPVAESLVDRSKVQNDVGRYAEAEAALLRAIPILERAFGREHPDLAIAHQNLGNAYLYQGKHDLARRELQQALAIKRARYPAGAATIAFSVQSLAIIDLDAGDLAAAQRGFQEAYDLRVKALGEEHPETLSSLYELGVIARMQGRHDDARKLLERVLAGRIHHFGEEHTSVANVLDALANVDQSTGKLDAAVDERKRSLVIRQKLLGPDAGDLTISLLGLAEIELQRGHCADARDYGERALAIFDHNHAAWFERLEALGVTAYCEDRAPALASLRAQLEPMVEQALAGKDVDRRGDAQFALGLVLYKQGERAKGIAMIKRGAAAYRDGGQPDGAQPMEQWLAEHR